MPRIRVSGEFVGGFLGAFLGTMVIFVFLWWWFE